MVLTSGYNSLQTASGALDTAASSDYIFIYDISQHVPVQKQVLQIPAAYAGIAFSSDGQRFYVGSGGGDSIYTYSDNAGIWSQLGEPIALGHKAGVGNNQGPSTAGLAVTDDGTRLLVANSYNDSVTLVDLKAGKVVAELDLRPGVINAANDGVAGGETPFGVTIIGTTAYVGSQRDREIDVVELQGDKAVLRTRVPVRGTPVGMTASQDGTRLYVAADNDDSVQVIDTRSDQVVQIIPVEAPFGLIHEGPRYRGVAPNALALSADGRTLYVSNGGENAVAVVSLGEVSKTVGLIPTGWYPNSVVVADGWLYAVNSKSDPGPNPGNCQGSLSHEKSPPPYAASCQPNQYILQLEAGGLLATPIPTDPSTLTRLTLQVARNDGLVRPERPVDQAVMTALRHRIKHVIYIIKENRTYDQVLGDLGRGNGDPALTEFGQAITPNFHALSKGFVDLDNFEDSGSVSGNGWPWSTEGRETDFNVKTIPLNYSAHTTNAPYDSEGQVRSVDTGLGSIAARKAADPAYPNDPNLLPGLNSDDAPDGPDDDGPSDDTGDGHIWNAALAAGLSVRNYGFFCDLDRYGAKPNNYGSADSQIPEDPTPYADKVVQAYAVAPVLVPLTDPYYRGFDNGYPDLYRYNEWNREFTGFEQTGKLPSLTLLRLMHDHMGNFATGLNGLDTPELEQADNDYAVGLVAQRIAHSSAYKDNTLIFVLEDDAQDGPDHVNAHRSTAYVIGPYVKQGAVISQRYTTVNMLRTIEDVLGMGHLSINDAFQRPMTDVFDLSQTGWDYNATPSQYLYGTTLPLPTRQADAGPIPASTHGGAWWAAATRGYDFSHEDRVPAVAFNQVVWHGLFGSRPYPTLRSGLDMSALHKASAGTDKPTVIR